MPAAKSVWGIDVGQCALKALRLRYHNGQLEVQSFDVIEHAKILSQPDADEQQLIRTSLEKFLSRNDIRGSAVAISVPGQASFSRFIKLPPVDIRKVPEIVQYEARQQIPFDLDEVIWDHQVLSPPTAAPTELEVGIFAMKRDIVNDYVSDFLALRIEPDIVQMTPIALYNFFYFDKQEGPGATMILDMGAQNTNLIISDAERVWIRNIPMGGNNFTQALSKTFNLTFGKAEELKRHAAESKHGRKIFQAMRPVFADLLMEIQRSIGYYTSLHRESRIEHILALGNTFRVPGLTKFLSQGLGIEVMKFQGLNSLAESSKLNTPLFKENVLTFGTAFGLGIQGLGLGRIDTNLLPAGIRQQKVSRRKRPFFVAAAVSLLVALGCVGYSSLAARNALKGQAGAGDLMRQTVQGLIKENQKFSKRFDEERVEAVKALGQIAEVQQILDQRDYVYTLTRTVWDALPYDPRWLNWKPEEKDRIARGELEMVELLNVKIQYVSDVKDVIAKSSATAGHLDGMSMESPMPTVVKNSSL
ncbi:MAG: type IV pilus assembly protein PilM, partial [Phycisphaerae bacterium]|nr:type IV pilus assembly protein PilM [Phycisphaerae bacterium]